MKELKIIDEIRKRFPSRMGEMVMGIGDDAAVFRYDKEKYLLWAQDMIVEDVHFTLENANYRMIGRKAVAVNISDIASMGGAPKFITVSIGVPSRNSVKKVRAIYDGIYDICGLYGIGVAGGDLCRSEKIVVDISIMGFVKKSRLVTRSGAKTGDFILITGPVRDGRKEHLSFTPRVEEAAFLVKNYKINSMIDTSDGIGVDISRICLESSKGCALYASSIPIQESLSLNEALYGGESFELLFTMSSKECRRLFTDIGKNAEKIKFFIIGEIKGKEYGRVLIANEGVKEKLKIKGFEHF